MCGERFDARAIRPECLVARFALEQRENRTPAGASALYDRQILAERHELLEARFEIGAGDLFAGRCNDDARLRGTTNQEGLELALVLDERLLPAPLRAEQRWLRDVDVTAIDELTRLTVEERQQQCTDVRSVHVGVRHDDHAVIAELRRIE